MDNENQQPADTATKTTTEERVTLEQVRAQESKVVEDQSKDEKAAPDADKATEQSAESAADADGSSKSEAQDAAQPTIPEDANGYDFALPDVGLVDADGKAFQFADNDPLKAELGSVALKNKISKEGLSEILGLYAKSMVASQEAGTLAYKEQVEQRIAAERAKLETTGKDGKPITGEERVRNVLLKVDAALGEGASQKLAPGITTADSILVIEQLLARTDEAAGQPKDKTQATEGLRGAKALQVLRRG